jgi:hypothetical protein
MMPVWAADGIVPSSLEKNRDQGPLSNKAGSSWRLDFTERVIETAGWCSLPSSRSKSRAKIVWYRNTSSPAYWDESH